MTDFTFYFSSTFYIKYISINIFLRVNHVYKCTWKSSFKPLWPFYCGFIRF